MTVACVKKVTVLPECVGVGHPDERDSVAGFPIGVVPTGFKRRNTTVGAKFGMFSE